MIYRKFLHCVIAAGTLLLAVIPLTASAQTVEYDVEVIIFAHVRNTSVGSSSTLLLPVIENAQRIPEASVPGAGIQPLSELRLLSEAEKIRSSDNHRLLYHGGWRQDALDKENAPYMSIALGSSFNMLTEPGDEESLYLRGYLDPPENITTSLRQTQSASLFGGIKVWVGRFLHFDTLLAYTPRGADVSFAFQSERRMRSRQLHYIDNSRVGIITKIFPVDNSAPN